MAKTKIQVVIRNYFPNYTYENNIVEFDIPEEAAEIIRKSWRECNVHENYRTQHLCTNQVASVGLYKDDEALAGIYSVPNDMHMRNTATKFVKATKSNSLEGNI